MSEDKIKATLEKSMKVGIRSIGDSATKRVSTGNYPIDYVLGGGMPLGRMVELFGAESTGKSTLAIQTGINLAERTQKPVVYFDYEGGSFEDSYAEALGAEPGMFLVVDPITKIEDAAKVLHGYAGDVSGFIWDSVAAAVPASTAAKIDKINMKSEDNPYTGGPIGSDARAFSTTLKLMNKIIREHNLMAVFINQLRTDINTMGRSTITTPGGRALKFYASIRIEIKKVAAVQGMVEDPLTGEAVKRNVAMREVVQTAKNKTTDPFRSAEVLLTFGDGFDELYSLIEVACSKGVIKAGGGGYYKLEGVEGEEVSLRGVPKLREYLVENDGMIESIKEECGWAIS